MKRLPAFILVFIVSGVAYFMIGALGFPIRDCVIIIKVLVWMAVPLAPYFIACIIPFFNMKKRHYIDLTVYSAGLLALLVVTMCFAKSFDEYDYLDFVAFLAGLLPLMGMAIDKNADIAKNIRLRSFKKKYKSIISNTPEAEVDLLANIFFKYGKETSFTARDSSDIIELSVNVTSELLDNAQKNGLLIQEGQHKPKQFRFK